MDKIRVLDLFCGAGGVCAGMMDHAHVTGVDNVKNCKRYYPGRFIHGDVFTFYKNTIEGMHYFDQFDLIWASPVCTKYSIVTKRWIGEGKNYDHVDLIPPTRELLQEIGKPYVIENVVGAPLREDLMLCGLMVGLPLYRHRIFEIEGFECEQPEHPKHKGQQKFSVYGNPQKKVMKEHWIEAMGITHIPYSSRHFAKAIPPKFSEYIIKQFLTNYKGVTKQCARMED